MKKEEVRILNILEDSYQRIRNNLTRERVEHLTNNFSLYIGKDFVELYDWEIGRENLVISFNRGFFQVSQIAEIVAQIIEIV